MTSAIFAAGATCAYAQGNSDLIWIDYPEQGVVLGQGYNLVTDEPTLGLCVDFVPVQDPSQEISYRFEEVTSHSTINASSRIHASGSLKMALVKASAKLDFYSKENFSIDTSKFLLSARVTNSSLFASPSFAYKRGATLPTISSLPTDLQTAASKGIISAAAPDTETENTGVKFKNAALRNNIKHCGQGYVAAIVSGAEVDAFLTFSKSDAEAVAEIKAGIKASIGGIFSVSGSFAQNQQSVERSQRTEVSVYRSGGRAAAIAYDLPGLRTSLQNLPVDAAATPRPVRIAIMPYSKLDDSPLSGGLQAVDLLESIASFFLVRDVVTETTSITDWYLNYDVDQVASGQTNSNVARNIPLYLHPLEHYIGMNDRALALNRELSEVLRRCQSALQEANLLQDAIKKAAEAESDETPDTPRELEAKQRAILAGPIDERLNNRTLETFLSDVIGDRANEENLEILKGVFEKLDVGEGADRLALFVGFLAKFSDTNNKTGTRAQMESALANPDATINQDDFEALKLASDAKLAACNSSGGYLQKAVQDSLQLSQEFLAAKPIFWSDLGRHYQGRIWKLFPSGSLPQDQTSSGLVAMVEEELKSFHKNMVAKRFKRDICSRDLTHPVCGSSFDDKYEEIELNSSTLVAAGLSAGLARGLE